LSFPHGVFGFQGALVTQGQEHERLGAQAKMYWGRVIKIIYLFFSSVGGKSAGIYSETPSS